MFQWYTPTSPAVGRYCPEHWWPWLYLALAFFQSCNIACYDWLVMTKAPPPPQEIIIISKKINVIHKFCSHACCIYVISVVDLCWIKCSCKACRPSIYTCVRVRELCAQKIAHMINVLGTIHLPWSVSTSNRTRSDFRFMDGCPIVSSIS